MTTEFIKDIPDYKRLTDEQCREIVKWGLENGLLRWPPPPPPAPPKDLSRDLRPKPQRKDSEQ